MKTEIEAKWLRIDKDSLRRKLKAAGATLLQPERLMRRKTYDYADQKLHDIGAWVRIRDEGDKVTMSFKQLEDRALSGTKEVNLTVDSYEEANVFLSNLDLIIKSQQDTKRESWTLDGCEVELDTWPWIPSFIEIEGPSEAAVYGVAKKLSLKMENALYGSVEPAYQDVFNITDAEIDGLKSITFDEPVPEWVEKKRRV
jgi:adenylate cyclase class 2